MKKLGLEVVLLTEDKWPIAQRLAHSIGIDRVFAQVKPPEKVEIIRTLQSTFVGKHRSIVAMVGSEIDNAPGLAQADVGIAMGKSIDLASTHSDIQIYDRLLQRSNSIARP